MCRCAHLDVDHISICTKAAKIKKNMSKMLSARSEPKTFFVGQPWWPTTFQILYVHLKPDSLTPWKPFHDILNPPDSVLTRCYVKMSAIHTCFIYTVLSSSCYYWYGHIFVRYTDPLKNYIFTGIRK